MSTEEIKARVHQYLKDSNLPSFLAWLSGIILDIENSDSEAIRLAYAIQRETSDVEMGFIDEGQLMANLQVLLLPKYEYSIFVKPDPHGITSGTSTVMLLVDPLTVIFGAH